ncbi:MAG TPA: macrolide ABC transporter ATP-binding protein [Clostridiales bacterium]|nr:macrolide ABC transporter ATP-binding protein [Clostridiales bacterium]
MSAPGPLLRLRDVGKTYPGAVPVAALADIQLEVNPGEFTAVMGPSGSGKSTLLHILGCLDRPSRGEYHLSGRAVGSLGDADLAAVRNRHIGFVFQSFHLLPRLTALENVGQPLIYAGAGPAERRRRALAALDEVGLTARVHHRPPQLSGGERQRVAIARAIINRPAIILADEPTGNLDSRSGSEVMGMLFRLHRSGTTVILVTHNANLAEQAGRLIRMHDGRVVEDTGGARQ